MLDRGEVLEFMDAELRGFGRAEEGDMERLMSGELALNTIGVESMEVAMLVYDVEARFKIKIDDAEFGRIASFAEKVDYICSREVEE